MGMVQRASVCRTEARRIQLPRSRLGRHKMGKGCLYISKMSDIDFKVLEQLLKESVAESKRQQG
jgi:hypothetical protein